MRDQFPTPKRISPATTRWSPEDIHAWETAKGIEGLPPLQGMATVDQLAERYAVSRSTIWRWAAMKPAAA